MATFLLDKQRFEKTTVVVIRSERKDLPKKKAEIGASRASTITLSGVD
jgi:hypothetical protein